MDRQKKVWFLMVLVTHNCCGCNQIYKKWNELYILDIKGIETMKAWYINLNYVANFNFLEVAALLEDNVSSNTAEKSNSVKIST